MDTTIFYDITFTHSTEKEIIYQIEKNSNARIVRAKPDSKIYHFLNAFCITEFNDSPDLKKCYQSNRSVNLCDGVSVAIFHRLFLNKSINRIRGGDFLRNLLNYSPERKFKIGVLGGSSDSLKGIVSSVHDIFPNSNIVYAYEPPFAEVADYPINSICQGLQAAELDLCLVAIGTPKQDLLADILSKQVDIDFFCIGAGLEFVLGRKKEAPKVMQNLGLEWLFRLISEPRRLGKRYLIGIPKFISIIFSFYLLKNISSKKTAL